MKSTPHYQHGNQEDIAVVFSCPGQEEGKNNCPTSGITGKNLELLLEILFKNGFLKAELTKADLRITNAWDKVLYKSKDGRTEAKLNKKEIYSQTNLDRLLGELDSIKTIICFGVKAKKAVNKLCLNDNRQILFLPHLSLQSLNSNKDLKEDINGRKLIKGNKNNTYKRLEVLGKKLQSISLN